MKSYVKYTTFSNAIDLLTEIDKGNHLDIFLLDVVMSGMDGIELAKEIRNKNSVSKIIYLTTSPEYAVESYGVNAFYYILKPIEKAKLISLFERACADIFNKREKFIVAKSQTGLTKIYLDCIQFVEVIGRNIYFHLSIGEIIKSPCSISQIESELLIDKRFIKTHRSYIVNMNYIKNRFAIPLGNLRVPFGDASASDHPPERSGELFPCPPCFYSIGIYPQLS